MPCENLDTLFIKIKSTDMCTYWRAATWQNVSSIWNAPGSWAKLQIYWRFQIARRFSSHSIYSTRPLFVYFVDCILEKNIFVRTAKIISANHFVGPFPPLPLPALPCACAQPTDIVQFRFVCLVLVLLQNSVFAKRSRLCGRIEGEFWFRWRRWLGGVTVVVLEASGPNFCPYSATARQGLDYFYFKVFGRVFTNLSV